MINLKKKKKIQKTFLLNSLFQSKNFYGKSVKNLNKENLPFVLGIRHKFCIINLKHTIFFLKRIFQLINKCLTENKKILIIGDSLKINFLLNKQFIKNNKNIILSKEPWVNGLLTNKTIPSFLRNEKIDLIIFLKSETNEKFLLTEIYNSKIPVIALCNTDSNLKYINYPILSNTENLKSVFFLTYLIRKIINK